MNLLLSKNYYLKKEKNRFSTFGTILIFFEHIEIQLQFKLSCKVSL